jgi:hypothetical protein
MVASGRGCARGGIASRSFRPTTVDQATRHLLRGRLASRLRVPTPLGWSHKGPRGQLAPREGNWQSRRKWRACGVRVQSSERTYRGNTRLFNRARLVAITPTLPGDSGTLPHWHSGRVCGWAVRRYAGVSSPSNLASREAFTPQLFASHLLNKSVEIRGGQVFADVRQPAR